MHVLTDEESSNMLVGGKGAWLVHRAKAAQAQEAARMVG